MFASTLVALISISLMSNHVEHFLMCLWATCVSPLDKFSSILFIFYRVVGVFIIEAYDFSIYPG